MKMQKVEKEKRPRRIIFEESGEDCVKPGGVYYDDFGMPNVWCGKGQSWGKVILLRKIHDDFEMNNG